MAFGLDSRIAESTHLVKTVDAIHVRLVDDSRYMWVMLVPEVAGTSELHDLGTADQHRLMTLATRLGAWLKGDTGEPMDESLREIRIEKLASFLASQAPANAPVYKICDAALWREAEAAGQFTGAEIDIKDGYIHFSTATQAQETARKHFKGREGLVFVAIDTSKLNMVWEPSRGGDLFPHLYDTLPVETAISITPMHPDADGTPVPVGGFPAS